MPRLSRCSDTTARALEPGVRLSSGYLPARSTASFHGVSISVSVVQ